MKTILVSIAGGCFFSSVLFGADLINGGFETGVIDGWTFSLEGDLLVDRDCPDGSSDYYIPYPYGPETIPPIDFASVVEDAVVAPEGSHYLILEGLDGKRLNPFSGYPSWVMGDGCTYSLAGRSGPCLAKLEQTISLGAGQGIEFMAEYGSDSPYRETPGLDEVWLEVNDLMVWHQDTTALGPSLTNRSTGWINHSYVAPASGDYTFSFVSEHQGDFGHHLSLDAIRFVPEPTTFTLLGLGSLVLTMVRRRR